MNADDPGIEAALIRLRDAAADRPPAMAGADPAQRALGAEWDRQDAALRALYDPVEAEPLPEAMRAALSRAEARPIHRASFALRRPAAALVLVALGALGGYLAARLPGADGTGLQLAANPIAPDPFAPGQIAAAAFRAHATYAVEMRHPVEVTAAEPKHLATWLSKRLGRAITPPDLASLGYRLLGGRVLPDRTGTAALMMYEDAMGGRLTLYVTLRSGAGETALRFAEAGTRQGAWWIDGAIGCAVIGEIDRATLRAIATAAYDQLI